MATQILGIAGGSGSGKTYLSTAIHTRIGTAHSSILLQDHYYIDQSDRFDKDGGAVNFDHPSALDFDLLATHLRQLKKGISVEIPQYEFKKHERLPLTLLFPSKKLIIVDGTLILSQKNILEELDFSIFVETPEHERFERRLRRDVSERGRSPEGVHEQFYKQVKPMHDKFVEPSKHQADLILSGLKDIEEILSKAFKIFDL